MNVDIETPLQVLSLLPETPEEIERFKEKLFTQLENDKSVNVARFLEKALMWSSGIHNILTDPKLFEITRNRFNEKH